MDFKRYKEINDERLNYREMEDATVVSTYRNVGCGDGYRIFLKIDNDLITDASYTTTGCGFGMVALAMVTELAKNKSIEEAINLSKEDIEKQFEFPERRKGYPESAIAALQKALSDFKNNSGIPKEQRITANAVLKILKEKGNLTHENFSNVILEGKDFS